jgi:hypothetical protein
MICDGEEPPEDWTKAIVIPFYKKRSQRLQKLEELVC